MPSRGPSKLGPYDPVVVAGFHSGDKGVGVETDAHLSEGGISDPALQ